MSLRAHRAAAYPESSGSRRATASRDESDRAARLARVGAHAMHVFNREPKYALEWLRKAQAISEIALRSSFSRRIQEHGCRGCPARSGTWGLRLSDLWRFTRHTSLDGRGGLCLGPLATRATKFLYCAPNPATALLEFVHAGVSQPAALGDFKFLKLRCRTNSPTIGSRYRLPTNWSPARS